jgi:microcystin degradation protein MlrC
MRVFRATFATETNTFSPIPTGIASFVRRGKSEERWAAALEPLITRGAEVLGTFEAYAEPSAPIARTAYETLRDELLTEIVDALPLDYIFLRLHGAMVAYGYDDCEGDLLRRIRAAAGSHTSIGGTLDLHCHLTKDMIEASNLLIMYKEYPHFDAAERLKELVVKLISVHEGHIKPVPALFAVPAINLYPTDREPMRSFVDKILKQQRDREIVSISVAHGFPWGDVPEMGTKVLVYTDGASAKGMAVARDLGEELFALRKRVFNALVPCHDAVRIACSQSGVTVIADVADNPGGGAPGDSTFLLNALLEGNAQDVAFGALWDPVAVNFAMQAGVGQRIKLRVGGKAAAVSGEPLDVEATITALRQDYTVPLWDIDNQPYGDCAAIELKNNFHLVLSSKRGQTYSPLLFENLGIDVRRKRILAVKSAHHFNREFGPIADHVFHVASPGALNMDFATIPYKRVKRPIWPLDDIVSLPGMLELSARPQ